MFNVNVKYMRASSTPCVNTCRGFQNVQHFPRSSTLREATRSSQQSWESHEMVAHVQFSIVFRPKYRLKRMFMGFMALSIAVSHYQNAFAAIYLSEEEIPEPRIMHFDDGFDVLFDNGANVSIGISKEVSLYLR